MKSTILTLAMSLFALGTVAQATCDRKEEKASATAQAIGALNGIQEIKLTRPMADSEKYGTYSVSISGVRNGFFEQGSGYEITISDDGFCSVVSVKRSFTIE